MTREHTGLSRQKVLELGITDIIRKMNGQSIKIRQ